MFHRRIVLPLAFVFAALALGVGAWMSSTAPTGATRAPDAPFAERAVDAPRASGLDAPLLDTAPAAEARERSVPGPQPAEPAGRVVIAGRVVDETGAPVADAVVEVRTPFRGPRMPSAFAADLSDGEPTPPSDVPVFDADAWRVLRRPRVEPVLTDAQGRFRFEELPAGAWTVAAWMQGHDTESLELGELASGVERADLELRLQPARRVRVVVVTPDGSPVAGALVSVRAHDGHGGRDDRRRLWFEASALGWERAPSSVPSPSETGEPLTTGPDGTGEFLLPRCARWTLYANAQRLYAGGAGLDVPESASALLVGKRITWCAHVDHAWPPPAELRVELAPARVLVGRVTNARGEPVRAGLCMTDHGPTQSAYTFSSAECDASGAYCYPGLPAAVVTIQVEAGIEYEPVVAELDLAPVVQRRDFVLQLRPALLGVVRDPRGEPCANAKVELVTGRKDHAEAALAGAQGRTPTALVTQRRTTTTTTDAEGRFRFQNVPLGAARVVASSTGWLASAPLEVEVTGDAADLEVAVFLRAGASIEGRAFGKGGVALAQRIVHFHREDDAEKVESALTDAVGAFRLFHLEPGRWTFELELDPGEPGGDAMQPLALARTVETEDARTTRVELAPD